MSSKISLTIRSNVSQTQLNDDLLTDASLKSEQLQKMKNFFSALEGGADQAVIDMQLQTSATGTFTVATSGASALVIGTKVLTGGTDYVISNLTATQIASNIVTVIKASTDAQLEMVLASSSAGVVTLTSLAPGVVGNLIPISGSGEITASAAKLNSAAGALRIMNYNLVL